VFSQTDGHKEANSRFPDFFSNAPKNWKGGRSVRETGNEIKGIENLKNKNKRRIKEINEDKWMPRQVEQQRVNRMHPAFTVLSAVFRSPISDTLRQVLYKVGLEYYLC